MSCLLTEFVMEGRKSDSSGWGDWPVGENFLPSLSSGEALENPPLSTYRVKSGGVQPRDQRVGQV